METLLSVFWEQRGWEQRDAARTSTFQPRDHVQHITASQRRFQQQQEEEKEGEKI